MNYYRYFINSDLYLDEDAASEMLLIFQAHEIEVVKIYGKDEVHIGWKLGHFLEHTKWIGDAMIEDYRLKEIFLGEDHLE